MAGMEDETKEQRGASIADNFLRKKSQGLTLKSSQRRMLARSVNGTRITTQ